jgi:LPS sulfotransferase NodH
MLPASAAAGSGRPRFGDGRKCIFIASEVRCGSTFVAETVAYELNKSGGYGLWGLAKEKFSFVEAHTGADEMLNAWSALYLDAHGVASSKLMCRAISFIYARAQDSEDVREAFFGENAYWIVVRRQDRIEQAVSLALALKTKTFHHYGDPETAEDNTAELSLEEMDWALKAVSLTDIYLQAFAASLPKDRVLSINYNDFVADEAGYLEKIHNLCGFPPFNRANYVNESKIKKTGRNVKQFYVEQFREWFLAHLG